MTAFSAPVVLFVYNRPEHTRRTLETLKRNDGTDQSKLYIFSDGPKEDANDNDRQHIGKVRELIRSGSWCRTVKIIESAENRGLADSIREGVSSVLQSHDRVIVLEDDLETSRGFLTYMNDALELYADEAKVFQVSGFMVKNRPWVQPTGFLRVSTSWGWGTWRRAWRYYRDDADNLLSEVAQKGKSKFDLDGHSFHFEELERNVSGDLRTWAVRWYASVFLNDGLCLYPRRSLVRNLGFDGTGVNCHDDQTRYQQTLKLAKAISVLPQNLHEDGRYLRAMQLHYDRLLQQWTKTRFRDRLSNKIRRTLGMNL